jgi:BMFP domain-containing protein YqiC
MKGRSMAKEKLTVNRRLTRLEKRLAHIEAQINKAVESALRKAEKRRRAQMKAIMNKLVLIQRKVSR